LGAVSHTVYPYSVCNIPPQSVSCGVPLCFSSTVTALDVVQSLKREGKLLYGYA